MVNVFEPLGGSKTSSESVASRKKPSAARRKKPGGASRKKPGGASRRCAVLQWRRDLDDFFITSIRWDRSKLSGFWRTPPPEREATAAPHTQPCAPEEAADAKAGVAAGACAQARDALAGRGERLDALGESTERMGDEAREFAGLATELRRKAERGGFW